MITDLLYFPCRFSTNPYGTPCKLSASNLPAAAYPLACSSRAWQVTVVIVAKSSPSLFVAAMNGTSTLLNYKRSDGRHAFPGYLIARLQQMIPEGALQRQSRALVLGLPLITGIRRFPMAIASLKIDPICSNQPERIFQYMPCIGTGGSNEINGLYSL